MTLHSLSDQYWVDRQRDMMNSDRTHGLVNSMSVVDRPESFQALTNLASGMARACVGLGKLVQSAVIRARQAANRQQGGVTPGAAQAA